MDFFIRFPDEYSNVKELMGHYTRNKSATSISSVKNG